MRITAILPTLDEESRLAATLESLRAAGVDERVVSDGGSTDATLQIAREYGALIIQGSVGRAQQMNRAAAMCTSEVLWFVHADVLVPEHGAEEIRTLLADPSIIAGAFRTRTCADGPPRAIDYLLPLADLRSHYTWHPYGDQALFVRRAAFEKVGGFPVQALLEDLELSRRLWAVGRLATSSRYVRVSGRRFLSRPFYYGMVMNLFPILYRIGVSPERLARWYGKVR